MRWVLWILGLFALAVGLALALRFNTGYVLLVWPPHRVELSLNLLLLLQLAAFVVFYLLLRFVAGAVALPSRVREFRARRAREKARALLLDALQAYLEGSYGRAEKSAAAVIDSGESPALAAVLAARAAHELRHYEPRDRYLARAGDTAMRVVSEADMLLDQRRFQEALIALKALPRKHTAALRLELKAQQQARNWEHTLPLIDQLEKRGVYDAAQVEQLRRHAYAENLRRRAQDRHALEECWQKIPAPEKRDSGIAAAAARGYIALGGCAQAQQIVEQALDAGWDSGLVAIYADCEGPDTVRQIERAEQWLQAYPRDAALLLVLGRLCARQELWGKAQSYLEASLSLEATCSAHYALAQLHERLERGDAARKHYRASLDLALKQLQQATGGRRKSAL